MRAIARAALRPLLAAVAAGASTPLALTDGAASSEGLCAHYPLPARGKDSSESSPPLPPPSPAAAAARASRVAHFLSALSAAGLPSDAVVTAASELAPLAAEEHSWHVGAAPDVAVHPRSTGEVSAVLRAATSAGLAVVARGGGTSLEGHTLVERGGGAAARGAVVLDLSHMDGIVAVRPADLDCTVQAGVRWQALNAALAPHGLFFPMDPGPGAALGGMAGTGCSGTNAVRHGAMKANVLALTAVLADGTVLRTGGRARKSVAGYDLASLLVGSEGTLAVVTELDLRLQPLPAASAVAACAFPTARDACVCAAALARAGVQVAAVELLDAPMMAAVNAHSGFAYAAQPHLFFKFAGSSPARVADDARRARAAAVAAGGSGGAAAGDAATADRLWEARKHALWSVRAMDSRRSVATTDVCVPLSRLPDLVAAAEARTAASPLKTYLVAHAGDGNAHHFLAFDPDDADELREAHDINAFLVRTAQAMDGSCTGEHGVGFGKLEFTEAELGAPALAAMRAIKHALDPHDTLNPGKKLPRGV